MENTTSQKTSPLTQEQWEEVQELYYNTSRTGRSGILNDLYTACTKAIELADSEWQKRAVEAHERLAAENERTEAAWANRNRFCKHINIIGHEVLGFKSDSCAPDAVSRETKVLVDKLRDELARIRKLGGREIGNS